MGQALGSPRRGPRRAGRARPPARDHDGQRTEFTARAMDAWAHAHGVELRASHPGTSTHNPFIESFNEKFRDECLNEQ